MKSPNIYNIKDFSDLYNWPQINTVCSEWVPARPLGMPGIWQRLKCSFMVFFWNGRCGLLARSVKNLVYF